MAIRNVYTKDDEALRKVCRPVEKFDEKLAELLDDMLEAAAGNLRNAVSIRADNQRGVHVAASRSALARIHDIAISRGAGNSFLHGDGRSARRACRVRTWSKLARIASAVACCNV